MKHLISSALAIAALAAANSAFAAEITLVAPGTITGTTSII